MAGDAEAVEQEATAEEKPRSPYALLVELEGAAVNARRAQYEALRSLLAEHKVDVKREHFSRFCLGVSPATYLPALIEALGGKKQIPDSLPADVKSGVTMFLSSPDATLNPAAEGLLNAAHERHMDVALLSSEKATVVQSLVGRWGGNHGRTKVFTFEPGSKTYPRADAWLKVAKGLSRTPSQCIVLAGSSYSVKTALSAGMRCVAVPDEFTAHQDYSGADAVLETAEDHDPRVLLDLIAPLKPFI